MNYYDKLEAFGFYQRRMTAPFRSEEGVPLILEEIFKRRDGWCIACTSINCTATWCLEKDQHIVIRAHSLEEILRALPLTWAEEAAQDKPDLVIQLIEELKKYGNDNNLTDTIIH